MQPIAHLIIDGNSLLYSDPDLASVLQSDRRQARQKLIAKVARFYSGIADRTTLVFDGRGSRTAEQDRMITAIQVIYSGGAQTADSVIERMVHDETNPGQVLVVTSDRAELDTVSAAGAQTVSCRTFLDQISNRERQASQTGKNRQRAFRGSHLGEFFPEP